MVDRGGLVGVQRPYIVVPVYNNHGTVGAVVESLLPYGLPLIVVDDGSTDGSWEAVQRQGVRCIRHDRNRGKGAALVTAGHVVREEGGTHVICFDADGQFDPLDVASFLRLIEDHPETIVYGVRKFPLGQVPRLSVFGRSFSNFWVRVTTGEKVTDSQCGFRAYPIACLLDVPIKSTRYDFEVEVLVRSAWAGVKLIGEPVSVTYSPEGQERTTHFRPFVDNARISLTYTRLVARALLPVPYPVFVPVEGREGGQAPRKLISAKRPREFIRCLVGMGFSPSHLAVSAALGLFLATLPLVGLHGLAILLAASSLGLNRILAFSVSHVCAPPVVPALCIEVGSFVLHGEWVTGFQAGELWARVGHLLFEYCVGTVFVAPVLAIIGGVFTYCVAWGVSRVSAGSDRGC